MSITEAIKNVQIELLKNNGVFHKENKRKMIMYTIEKCFSNRMSKTIKATGRNWDINYSSILTKLIQECGRLCESYASDLFITWNRIHRKLEEKTMETSTYLFGIREMGVDHTEFILSRYENNGENARYIYRKIYRLDVLVNDGDIVMELYEIYKPYSERVVV